MDDDFYKYKMSYASEINGTNRTPVKYKLFLRSNQNEFNGLFLDYFTVWLKEHLHNNLIKGLVSYGRINNKPMDIHSCTTFRRSPLKLSDFNYGLDKTGFFLNYSGTWENTIHEEVPLMAGICETFYRCYRNVPSLAQYRDTVKKAWENCSVPIVEMGTRRRISLDHQREALGVLKGLGLLKGTSNVDLSKEFDVPLFGSVAHEFYMAMGNERALADWLKCGFDTNIALPDTFTTDEFLKVFDKEYANRYDGVRQDSGSPFEFADKFRRLYESYNIDTTSKTMVFSDSLDAPKINKIDKQWNDIFKCVYGVGTNVSGIIENNLRLVIKMVEFDGKPVHKKSDDPRKST